MAVESANASPDPGRIDLHAHTTASDGTLSPAHLVVEARRRGISVLGVTDHDTIDGIARAEDAGAEHQVTIVPGVELSTTVEGAEVHILGYFVDRHDVQFVARLASMAAGRKRRITEVIRRLQALGFALDAGSILAAADDGSIGRPHVARALVELGVVSSVNDAFDRYLRRGRPGFVPREPFSPEEAVRLLVEHSAVPVLAHPFSTKAVKATVRRLVPVGLAGIEVYYGEYNSEQQRSLRAVAETWRLLTTGGSDYHGPNVRAGRELGCVDVPASTLDRLRAASSRAGTGTGTGTGR